MSLQFRYPHINIDSSFVKEFKWIPQEEIRCHEEYIEERHNALYNYLIAIDSPIVPCILIDSKTKTIIDGHHRFSVMKKLGWKHVPCLLLDYDAEEIITHPTKSIEKSAVIKAGVEGVYLPPKTTQHMIKDSEGNLYPIACFSLMVQYNPMKDKKYSFK